VHQLVADVIDQDACSRGRSAKHPQDVAGPSDHPGRVEALADALKPRMSQNSTVTSVVAPVLPVRLGAEVASQLGREELLELDVGAGDGLLLLQPGQSAATPPRSSSTSMASSLGSARWTGIALLRRSP